MAKLKDEYHEEIAEREDDGPQYDETADAEPPEPPADPASF